MEAPYNLIEVNIMYKVQFKVANPGNAWAGYGSFGSQSVALQAAARISTKYFMVRVVDDKGALVWSN